jgi:hypothetical protein
MKFKKRRDLLNWSLPKQLASMKFKKEATFSSGRFQNSKLLSNLIKRSDLLNWSLPKQLASIKFIKKKRPSLLVASKTASFYEI